MSVAGVNLWGRQIGAVSQERPGDAAVFSYTPEFLGSGIEVAPITMPLRADPYTFPALVVEAFRGLPGLLADSLPDKFGNALIDAWLGRQGRTAESFDAVERLSYIGRRGMGALEYEPARGPRTTASHDIEIAALVELASEVLSERSALAASLGDGDREQAVRDILLVGTSAGGARAKALIAWNPETNAVRSGQVDAGPGFEYWLLKFDGVRNNKDRELEDPLGYGLIEYAYSLMARDIGITMMPCRVLAENGRRHFMTQRFDRLPDGDKVHVSTLAALLHLDYNLPGAHSYEQALQVCRRLSLDARSAEEVLRRAIFNVVARNQDDHVKNFAFLMGRDGRWHLAPAYDMTYAYQPGGRFTARHQMTVNGRADDFSRHDFRALAAVGSVKRGRSDAILDEVREVVSRWPEYASQAGVDDDHVRRIAAMHRLSFSE